MWVTALSNIFRGQLAVEFSTEQDRSAWQLLKPCFDLAFYLNLHLWHYIHKTNYRKKGEKKDTGRKRTTIDQKGENQSPFPRTIYIFSSSVLLVLCDKSGLWQDSFCFPYWQSSSVLNISLSVSIFPWAFDSFAWALAAVYSPWIGPWIGPKDTLPWVPSFYELGEFICPLIRKTGMTVIVLQLSGCSPSLGRWPQHGCSVLKPGNTADSSQINTCGSNGCYIWHIQFCQEKPKSLSIHTLILAKLALTPAPGFSSTIPL